MTIIAPKYMQSKYYVQKGVKDYLKPEAPDWMKKEYEDYHNNFCAGGLDDGKFLTWEGKLIDTPKKPRFPNEKTYYEKLSKSDFWGGAK